MPFYCPYACLARGRCTLPAYGQQDFNKETPAGTDAGGNLQALVSFDEHLSACRALASLPPLKPTFSQGSMRAQIGAPPEEAANQHQRTLCMTDIREHHKSIAVQLLTAYAAHGGLIPAAARAAHSAQLFAAELPPPPAKPAVVRSSASWLISARIERSDVEQQIASAQTQVAANRCTFAPGTTARPGAIAPPDERESPGRVRATRPAHSSQCAGPGRKRGLCNAGNTRALAALCATPGVDASAGATEGAVAAAGMGTGSGTGAADATGGREAAGADGVYHGAGRPRAAPVRRSSTARLGAGRPGAGACAAATRQCAPAKPPRRPHDIYTGEPEVAAEPYLLAWLEPQPEEDTRTRGEGRVDAMDAGMVTTPARAGKKQRR
jgi:hypothetical protein